MINRAFVSSNKNLHFWSVLLLLVFGLTTHQAGAVWRSGVSAAADLEGISIAEALNETNLAWAVSGDASWVVQTNHTHDGHAAMQAGPASSYQLAILETVVTGPGSLTFWWNIDSDPAGADVLSLSIDGIDELQVSGMTGWEYRSVSVGPGTHGVRWTYSKDGNWSGGLPVAWLDQVQFVPNAAPPQIDNPPQDKIVWLGSNATLSVVAAGMGPLQYQWQLNSTNIPSATNSVLILTNVQFSQEGNYTVTVSSPFGSTNTEPAFLNVVSFAEAAGSVDLVWTGGADKAWFVQSSTTHDGVAAIQSGMIAGNQQSLTQTTVTGPGTVTFWWKVYSETNKDSLSLSVDGVEQFRISGVVNWQQRTCYLGAGTHELRWAYSKDATGSYGADAAWLDEVSFAAGATPAFVAVSPPNRSSVVFTNVSFSPTYGGTPPLSFQWRFNGVPIPNATNALLELAGVQTAHSGRYSVAVTNALGGALSSDSMLTVLPVYAWGAGRSNSANMPQNFGQVIVPPAAARAVAVAAGAYHSLALTDQGRVVAWGNNLNSQTNVPSLFDAKAIAGGLAHSLALRSNGTVIAWGSTIYSQTTVPAAATNVVAVAAGWNHNLALRSNGTVVAWGAGTYRGFFPHFGQSIVPTELSGVRAIAAGAYHSLALRTNGTVIAWGLNASGQTNVPAGLGDVIAIAAGASNSFALRRDGSLIGWGDNSSGQTNIPAGLTNVVAMAAGVGHQLALRKDGTLMAWGLNNHGQTNLVPGLTNLNGIAAGAYHNLALLNAGPVKLLNELQDLAVYAGDAGEFLVLASGAPPLGYQWQLNGTNLVGATKDVLAFAAAQFSDAGDYRVIVSNSHGAVTSSVARLDVYSTSPSIVRHPGTVNVMERSNAVISAAVTGLPPLEYQWKYFGTNLPGQTNASLTIANAQFTHEGPYSLAVTNAQGGVVSSNGFLNVIDLGEALNAPFFTWNTTTNYGWFPQSDVTHDGEAAAAARGQFSTLAILGAVVTGPGTVKYWWRESNPTFGIRVFVDGFYQSRYSGMGWIWQEEAIYLGEGAHLVEWISQGYWSSTAYIDEVRFEPGPTPPQFISKPSGRTVEAGADVTFSAVLGGTPPYTNRWLFNGDTIPGAAGPSLVLPDVQPGNSGTYTLIVNTAHGSTNVEVSLTVTNSIPYLTAQPASLRMVRNGNAFFSAAARGSDPLHYQWHRNGEPIPGATSPDLLLTQIQTNQAGTYQLAVSNAFGKTFSWNVSLELVPTVVVSWGYIPFGLTNPPYSLVDASAIAAADAYSVAVRSNGTLVAWGWDSGGRTNTAGITNAIAVEAGDYHGIALKSDGTVAVWGSTYANPAAIVPAGLSNVVQVGAGYQFNVVLKADGTLFAWGGDSQDATNTPAGLTDVVAIGTGQYHTLAVRSDGTVVSWGHPAVTNVPTGLSNVVAVAGGWLHSIALKNDGSVWSWGANTYTNVPADATNVVAVASGDYHGLGLRRDMTVIGWGLSSSGRTTPPFWLTNVVAIAAGDGHSIALLNDGSPYVSRHPWSRTASAGDDVELSMSALGYAPLAYQWRFNGADITGATNASLVLTNVALNQTGTYSCVVSNSIGSSESRGGVLRVLRSIPQFSGATRRNSDGSVALSLAGLSGHGSIVLYASTNLVDWTPVFTNPPIVGELLLNDATATDNPQRFYRFEER